MDELPPNVKAFKDSLIQAFATTNPQKAPPTFDRFKLFPKLPIELRLKIWKAKIEIPRTIRLELDPQGGVKKTHAPSPAVLGVCHESRKLGLKHYKLLCRPHKLRGGPKIFFYPDKDTIEVCHEIRERVYDGYHKYYTGLFTLENANSIQHLLFQDFIVYGPKEHTLMCKLAHYGHSKIGTTGLEGLKKLTIVLDETGHADHVKTIKYQFAQQFALGLKTYPNLNVPEVEALLHPSIA